MAGGIVLGIASLAVALAMIVYGRRYSHRLERSGFMFVTYPAIVLVFIAMGCALLIFGGQR